MQATTIDEVIQALDHIISKSKNSNDQAGYFAALYRKVTISIKQGIADGIFEDGLRMEKLDVIFANRYLKAYENYMSQKDTTKSWQIAFDKCKSKKPIVLQHLLWGMNAHINLDLGIAAVETIKSDEELKSLHNDFNKINEVLQLLVGGVQTELSMIWPFLGFILKRLGKLDDKIVQFSMKTARDGAWEFATELYKTSNKEDFIKERDNRISQVANYVNPSGFLARIVLKIIRLGEKGTVSTRIEILE
jgi:hypothetical protein